MIKTQWLSKSFSKLTIEELYDVLKLRSDVFVVEQDCVYSDLDSRKGSLDRHPETIHLLGYQAGLASKDKSLVAYLRILAKGQSYPDHISIGRVVTAKSARSSGLGHQLLEEALKLASQSFPQQNIKISAQEHLKFYYEKHGFLQVSAMYLEDGIPHISMVKNITSK